MSSSTLDQLYDKVTQSFTKDNTYQQALLLEIHNFTFFDLPEDTHYFCDEKLGTVCMYMLTICSSFVGDDAQAFPLFFKRFTKSFESCPNCLRNFHLLRGKSRIEFILKAGAHYNTVSSTMMGMFTQLQASVFSEFIIHSKEDSRGTYNLKVFMECLLNPELLRLNLAIKNYFDTLFNPEVLESDEVKDFISKVKLFPGIFYCLMEGNAQQRSWALNCLPFGKSDAEQLQVEDFSSLVMEEYERHFYRYQDPNQANERYYASFWTTMMPIIASSHPDVISAKLLLPETYKSYKESTGNQVVKLTNAFIAHAFSALDYALPFVLRALDTFLQKLKADFYETIKPHGYLALFDIAFRFNGPSYLHYLSIIDQNDRPDTAIERLAYRKPLFTDMLGWITSCWMAGSVLDKSHTTIIVYRYFADRMKEENYGIAVGYFCMHLMKKQLSLRKQLFDPKLTADLIRESNSRAIADHKAIVLFDAIWQQGLRNEAMDLITTCMIYDITLLAQYTGALRQGDASVSSQLPTDLWS
ncbi:unnamed protein product [Ambrosiozyma monospora]|uniref:Unnamed protein product n=1 Tax=Ambrosiozyma monospora TaxID=43982 RepID=A0ACB5T908_AMBMO|nr:unnamed protein product [Ambrosiozyma monospora]